MVGIPSDTVLIQTRPRAAGVPARAVQFQGNPAVHPDIFEDGQHEGAPRWRVQTTEDRGSQALSHGDWIIGHGQRLVIVPKDEFFRNWQVVPE